MNRIEENNPCDEFTEEYNGDEYSKGTDMVLKEDDLPAECVSEGTDYAACFDMLCVTANNICNAVTTWKEIDMQMHSMDVQFDYFSKQMDTNLEMYRQRAPIVGRQLDALSGMMNKILDKVLEMDAETEAEINNKMRLMDSVDAYVDKLTTMMTKLL